MLSKEWEGDRSKGSAMEILEVYKLSVRVITYLKEHPGGGVEGHGINLDKIARALRVKRSEVFPVIDYLLKEGYIARSGKSNDGLFRISYKSLIL